MIIGIYSPTLYRIGGGELVAINIIKSLQKEGINTIIFSEKKLNKTLLSTYFGEKIDISNQLNFSCKFFPPYQFYSSYFNALQLLYLKLNCDIAIDTYSNTALPWANIIYYHSSKPILKNFYIESLFKKLFYIPYKKLVENVNLNEKLLLVNSKYSSKFLEKEGVDYHILYPPVQVDYFNYNNNRYQYPRKNIVITVSRISPEKRLDLIPEIAKLVSNDIKFIIVGSLQSQKYAYSLIKKIKKYKLNNKIKILTDIPKSYLKNLLVSSKVYLHTMENENFGISIVEAMAAGCIPIVHNSGGPKEIVPKKQRYNDINELSNKINESISNWSTKKAEQMLKKARKFDEKTFSKEFLDLFYKYV